MQTLEYYGCDTTNNPLMWDIAEYWGHSLERMSGIDKTYLLWQLAEHYLLRIYPEVPISDFAQDYCDCLADQYYIFDFGAQTSLLRAIANRAYGKPLGYWGLDYSHPMIGSLYEQYGEGLAGINTTDAYMLITTISQSLCEFFHVDGSGISDEVEGIGDRVRDGELSEDQIHAFIHALGNT